jgi:hypothetical protein
VVDLHFERGADRRISVAALPIEGELTVVPE